MHLWLRKVTCRHDDLGCGFYKRMHSKKINDASGISTQKADFRRRVHPVIS
jgi:hypothetical protein